MLVVEDEYFLADEARRKLEELGALVVGPTGSVDTALDLIESDELDAAILDINLDGEMVFAVAERLEQLNIPYVFASGYDAEVVPESFRGHVFSEKPVDFGQIADTLFSKPKPLRRGKARGLP